MKIRNTSVFMGNDIRNAQHNENTNEKRNGGRTIDGSTLRTKFDLIAAKKEEAKKKAMKIVGDVFANECKIDEDLDVRRDKVRTLQAERVEAKKAIKGIEDDRATLRDTYGVDADSREEKYLKLLEKEIDAKIPGNSVCITPDEAKQIEKIKEGGLTEYQQRSLEMKEWEVPYATRDYEAKQEIKVENQIIGATELERSKSHAMLNANKQADAIMDAASEEIMGMLVDEAKEHIDEEAEEKKEAAKEKAEKKEELEARIEKTKEERKEKEEITEDILEGVSEVSRNSTEMEAAGQEIKDMMNKMKLIEDDIKGAAVDKSL